MIHASDTTVACKDGSRTEHSEQSDTLTKERRKAFRIALTELQHFAGDAGGLSEYIVNLSRKV